MGEFLRRAAASFRPSEDEQLLEGMIDQMLKTTAQASAAIDDALAFPRLKIPSLEKSPNACHKGKNQAYYCFKHMWVANNFHPASKNRKGNH